MEVAEKGKKKITELLLQLKLRQRMFVAYERNEAVLFYWLN